MEAGDEPMTKEELEAAIVDLEKLAAKTDNPYVAAGGMGDRVTGIRVIREGQIIQEYKYEEPA